MAAKKIMRLTPRKGESEEREIGGFKEDGEGFKVVDIKGKEMGYFGPDKYQSIIFEARWSD